MPVVGNIKVPHMGWNTVIADQTNGLFSKITSDARYYFVHSYYVSVNNPDHSLARSNYGIAFDSSIGRDNIYGVQFHPKKSQAWNGGIKKFCGAW